MAYAYDINKEIVDIDNSDLEVKPEIYKKHGNSVYVEFDKCFDTDKTLLNTFIISAKPAYVKNIDNICRYSNIFFKYYDLDKEFLTALLVIKYNIDNKNIIYTYDTFISDITEYLLTDSIIKKIYEMVDDYYEYYDINLVNKNEVKNENYRALQFDNKHGKILYALSIAYKLTVPIVCHFYTAMYTMPNNGVGTKRININDYLYKVFVGYLPLFQGDTDIFNKLAMTVRGHLANTRISDRILWDRAEVKKITPTTYTDKLISVIVTALMVKAVFSGNLIYLIQASIPKCIETVIMAKDRYEYCEINTNNRTDELSGLEKMEANNARISDLDIVISSLNIKNTIKKIKKDYKIEISDDEIDFYKKNLRTFAFSNSIFQFFAKYFGGVYDLQSISKKDYIILVILFKKIMANMGYIYIHQIMTGNVSNTIKRRKISTKQIKRIEQSEKFIKALKFYSHGMNETSNSIIQTIADLVDYPVEYVDYDNQERLGQLIVSDIDIVADEYLRFIKSF